MQAAHPGTIVPKDLHLSRMRVHGRRLCAALFIGIITARLISASPDSWSLKTAAWFGFGCLAGYALVQVQIIMIHLVRRMKKSDDSHRRSSMMHERRSREHKYWAIGTGFLMGLSLFAVPLFMFSTTGWVVMGATAWFGINQLYLFDLHREQAAKFHKKERAR